MPSPQKLVIDDDDDYSSVEEHLEEEECKESEDGSKNLDPASKEDAESKEDKEVEQEEPAFDITVITNNSFDLFSALTDLIKEATGSSRDLQRVLLSKPGILKDLWFIRNTDRFCRSDYENNIVVELVLKEIEALQQEGDGDHNPNKVSRFYEHEKQFKPPKPRELAECLISLQEQASLGILSLFSHSTIDFTREKEDDPAGEYDPARKDDPTYYCCHAQPPIHARFCPPSALLGTSGTIANLIAPSHTKTKKKAYMAITGNPPVALPYLAVSRDNVSPEPDEKPAPFTSLMDQSQSVGKNCIGLLLTKESSKKYLKRYVKIIEPIKEEMEDDDGNLVPEDTDSYLEWIFKYLMSSSIQGLCKIEALAKLYAHLLKYHNLLRDVEVTTDWTKGPHSNFLLVPQNVAELRHMLGLAWRAVSPVRLAVMDGVKNALATWYINMNLQPTASNFQRLSKQPELRCLSNLLKSKLTKEQLEMAPASIMFPEKIYLETHKLECFLPIAARANTIIDQDKVDQYRAQSHSILRRNANMQSPSLNEVLSQILLDIKLNCPLDINILQPSDRNGKFFEQNIIIFHVKFLNMLYDKLKANAAPAVNELLSNTEVLANKWLESKLNVSTANTWFCFILHCFRDRFATNIKTPKFA